MRSTETALLGALLAAASASLLSSSGSAAQATHESFSLDATVAELRMNAGLMTALHRASGRVPRPGEDWVTVHDTKGTEIARVTPSEAMPDATMVNVQEATSYQNTLVVSVYAGNAKDQYANVLLRYDLRSGELQRIIRIDPLVCWYLAVDGTSIWCLGGNADTHEQGRKDFDLLYRLTHDGVVLASALNWFATLPDVKFPVTIAAAGTPSLMLVDGGVRAWLPLAGRFVTWRPNVGLSIAALPSESMARLDRGGNQAVDTGGAIVITVPDGSSATDSRHLVSVWSDPGAGSVVAPTGATLPRDSLVVGIDRQRLLVWDRRADRVRWEPVPW
jgi:hypothetical protein